MSAVESAVRLRAMPGVQTMTAAIAVTGKITMTGSTDIIIVMTGRVNLVNGPAWIPGGETEMTNREEVLPGI